jgi:hypothetical protein
MEELELGLWRSGPRREEEEEVMNSFLGDEEGAVLTDGDNGLTEE